MIDKEEIGKFNLICSRNRSSITRTGVGTQWRGYSDPWASNNQAHKGACSGSGKQPFLSFKLSMTFKYIFKNRKLCDLDSLATSPSLVNCYPDQRPFTLMPSKGWRQKEKDLLFAESSTFSAKAMKLSHVGSLMCPTNLPGWTEGGGAVSSGLGL